MLNGSGYPFIGKIFAEESAAQIPMKMCTVKNVRPAWCTLVKLISPKFSVTSARILIMSPKAYAHVGLDRSSESTPVNPYSLLNSVFVFGAHRTDSLRSTGHRWDPICTP